MEKTTTNNNNDQVLSRPHVCIPFFSKQILCFYLPLLLLLLLPVLFVAWLIACLCCRKGVWYRPQQSKFPKNSMCIAKNHSENNEEKKGKQNSG